MKEKTFNMVAKTLFGFEDVLVDELRALGASDIEKGTRMVRFSGDLAMMYRANLCLRTAIKILKPIFEFYIDDQEGLYMGTQAVDWSQYLTPEQSFVIDSTVHSDLFTNSEFVTRRVKDAIVDQIRDKTGSRPSVEKDLPDLKINIHIDDDFCTLSFDSSGASLHLRGYRTAVNIAPINEVLGAGLLLLAGWKGQSDFLDPMCGSGTIAIEAAMIARNLPANMHRKHYAFEQWADYDRSLFELIKDESIKAELPFEYKIWGYDLIADTVEKAQENVANANLLDKVVIKERNFFATQKLGDQPLFMLFNPPYDERLDIEMETFYESIGNTMKRHYSGSTAWFITANLEALKFVGLKPSRKIKVYNGSLEAKLVKFDLYEGKKVVDERPDFVRIEKPEPKFAPKPIKDYSKEKTENLEGFFKLKKIVQPEPVIEDIDTDTEQEEKNFWLEQAIKVAKTEPKKKAKPKKNELLEPEEKNRIMELARKAADLEKAKKEATQNNSPDVQDLTIVTEAIEVVEPIEETKVRKVTKATKITEPTDAVKMTLVSKVTKITKSDEEAEVTDVTESTKVTKTPKVTKAAKDTEANEVTKAPKVPKATKAAKDTEANEVTKAPKAPKATKAAKEIEVTEAVKATKATKTTKATKPTEEI
jgi:putative N6-adenine-specific DNA methylase